MLFHEFLSSFKFFLNGVPCLFINNPFVTIFYIHLGYLPIIFDLFLREKINRVGLLEKCISHMLLIFKNSNYRCCVPFCLSAAPLNTFLFKFPCYLLRIYSRMLKNLGIGIIFEKENINTLDSTGELLFTILSSLAQDESRNISENCKWGIRTKFKKGELHLNTCKFLGYDKDEDGKLVINREQAKTVARIYEEFLWGMNPQQIARELEEEGVPGCCGQTKWYTTTVIGILKNEKHIPLFSSSPNGFYFPCRQAPY